VAICLIDVIRERSLAQIVAEALDVPHASPQVIVVRRGVSVWVASHRAIWADALAERVRNAEAAPAGIRSGPQR